MRESRSELPIADSIADPIAKELQIEAPGAPFQANITRTKAALLPPLRGVRYGPPGRNLMAPTWEESMRTTLFAFTVASLLSFGMASAQTRPNLGSELTASSKQAPGHTVSYKDRTQYDFDDDEVQGGRINPDGETVHGKLAPRFESMLTIRASFKPEMLKSVDTL